MRPLTFIVGASVGFLLGSRAGRETYDRIMANAQDLWRNPKTQEAVHHVEETVKAKAPGVQQKVADAASAVKGKIQPSHRGTASADQQYGGGAGPDYGAGTGTGTDHLSDPALADETGRDWTDEGGATQRGPATGA